MKLFKIFIVIFGVLTVGKSADVRLSDGVRSERSLPFLPAFLGGSNKPAVSSTVDEAETPEVPVVTTNQQQYPVWRVHRYNGVNLTPVSMASPLDSAETTASVVRQPEPDDYAVAGSENIEATVEQLPEELRQVAASLGLTDETAVPSLDDITSLLGTGSRDETVEFIKDLAESQEGLDLMRDFMTTFQTLSDDDIAAAETADSDASDYEIAAAESNAAPTVGVETGQTLSRTILPSSRFAGFASALDSTNTDINLLQRIIPAPNPSGGIFSGLNSFISYLRPPNNTPIPYRPLNTDLEKLTRPAADRIPIRNLPPVSPIPPIRGIPNLPAVPAIPPLHLPQHLTVEPIATNHGPPLNGYIQLNLLPVNRFVAPQFVRQPSSFYVANKQLAKLPLADVNYGSLLANSNMAQEFGRQPPSGLFVTRTNSVEGDYQTAASEPKVAHVEAPSLSPSDESTKVSRIQMTFGSSNESYNDIATTVPVISTKPQRVAGVNDDAYANGRIHKADPSAIDLPISVHFNSNAHQPRNLALGEDDEEEERKFIETVVELTSGQIRDTKEVDID